jgi:hypothetical protein
MHETLFSASSSPDEVRPFAISIRRCSGLQTVTLVLRSFHGQLKPAQIETGEGIEHLLHPLELLVVADTLQDLSCNEVPDSNPRSSDVKLATESVDLAIMVMASIVRALVWERTVATLPWQHCVVFRKR